MSASFSFSQRFDVHELLFWTVAYPVYRVAVAIDATGGALHAMLPALLVALVSVAKALGLVAAVAVAVRLWRLCRSRSGWAWQSPVAWLTSAILAAARRCAMRRLIHLLIVRFGRPPSSCPYCGGSVSAYAGRWSCNSCESEGSY